MANARVDPELDCCTVCLADGQWAGQPAFIIGGGPSLKGFDFNRLKGKGHVLGANMAWKAPACEIAYFKDQRLVNREKSASGAFGGPDGPLILLDGWARYAVKPDPLKRVFWVPKLDKQNVWGQSLSKGIIRAKNTGIEVVNIADCLGCSPIYLLGFDLNTPGGVYENWHNTYDRGWVPRSFGNAFNKWVAEWAAVKDQIRGQVVNLNPKSSLDLFPKQQPEEVLK